MTTKVPNTTPATPVSKLLHIVSIAIFANAFHTLNAPASIMSKMMSGYGGQWQFLTIIGLAFSMATMVCALAKDWLPNVKVFDVLKNALSIVATPMEGMISLLYWGISAYDPSLMTPIDGFRIPPVLDYSIHLAPAVLLWIDYLFFSPPFSKRTPPVPIAIAFGTTYTLWIERCASQNGYYPYPFLEPSVMSTPTKIVFYMVATLGMVGAFHLANCIHFGVDKMLGRNVQRAHAIAKGKSR